MNRHFTFRLKDSIVRGMTREQYYKVSHWVRYLAWKIEEQTNWTKFYKHFSDLILYGNSKLCFEDLLK